MLADIDGDSFTDVIHSADTGQSCNTNLYRNTAGNFAGATSVAWPRRPWEDGDSTPNGGLPHEWHKEGCSLSYQFDRRPTDESSVCSSVAANYTSYRLMDLDGDAIPELVRALDAKPGSYNPFNDPAIWPQGKPTGSACPSQVAPCRNTAGDPVPCGATYLFPATQSTGPFNPNECGCIVANECPSPSCTNAEGGCAQQGGTGGCECSQLNCDLEDSMELVGDLMQRPEEGADGQTTWPGAPDRPGTIGHEESHGYLSGMNQACRYHNESACDRYIWRVHKLNPSTGQWGAAATVYSPVQLESERATSTAGGGSNQNSYQAFIDLDGDTCLDALFLLPYHAPGGADWPGDLQVFRGDCNGGFRDDPPVIWNMPPDGPRKLSYGYSSSEPPPTQQYPGEKRRTIQNLAHLTDINGDGLPDYVLGSVTGEGLRVFYNTGTGFEDEPTLLSSDTSIDSLEKESAIVLQWKSAMNQILAGYSMATLRSHDFDSDGLEDLVQLAPPDIENAAPWNQSDDDVRIHVNVGDRLIPVAPSAETNQWWAGLARITLSTEKNWWVKTDVRDFNGDGLPDLFGSAPSSFCDQSSNPGNPVWAGCHTTGDIERDPDDSSGQGLRLLRSIDNGRGAVVEFEYTSTANTAVVNSNSGRTPSPVWVVHRMSVSPGKRADGSTAPPSTTEYFYSQPEYNKDRHGQWGFRGFRQVRVTDPPAEDGKFLRTSYQYRYDQDYSGRLDYKYTWEYSGSSAPEKLLSVERLFWTRATLFPDSSDSSRTIEAFFTTDSRTYTCDSTIWSQATWAQPSACLSQAPFTRTVKRIVPVYHDALSYSGISTSDLPSFGQIVQPSSTRKAVLYVTRGERLTDAGGTTAGDRGVVYGETLLYAAGRYQLLPTDRRKVVATTTSWSGYQLIGRSQTLYDAGGYGLAEETRVWHDATKVATTRRQFDTSTGNLVAVQRPNVVADLDADPQAPDLWTTISYEPMELYPLRVINELDHHMMFEFDFHHGKPTLVRGPLQPDKDWPEVATEYDGQGRAVRVQRSMDTGVGYVMAEVGTTTYFDFESPNRVETRQKLAHGTGAVASTWITREATFDGLDRPLTESVVLGPGVLATANYVYDLSGNLIEYSVPSPAQDGTLATYSYLHDSLGRVTRAEQPAAAGVWTFEYDGLQVLRQQEVTDGSAPMRVTLEHDPFGRLRTVTEERDGPDATWSYDYDANDNIDLITDADAIETSMLHDFVGNRQEVTRGGRTWRYVYDRHRNLTAETTPHDAGSTGDVFYTSTWSYDALDRLTSQRPAERELSQTDFERYFGTFDRLTIYTHDDLGHGSGFGRLTSVDLGFGTIEYDYSVEGWVTREERAFEVDPLGTAGPTLSDQRVYEATYNALGMPVTVTHADGTSPTVTTTIYEARGLPHKLESGSTLLAQLDRNLAGVPTLRTAHFAQGQSWTYDPLGRVTHHEIRSCNAGQVTQAASATCAESTGTVRGGETLSYYQTGNVHEVTDLLSTNQLAYSYDSQHQLTAATSLLTPAHYEALFEYTPAGRLLSSYVSSTSTTGDVRPRDVTYDYVGTTQQQASPADPAAVRQLLPASPSAPSGSFDYDPIGNLTHREYDGEDHDFVYDGHNRLREVILPDGSGEVYYYDHAGQRILAYSEASSTQLAKLRQWFGATEIEYDATTGPGTETRTQVFAALGAMPVARISKDSSGSTTELLYSGVLGSLLTVLSTQDGSPLAQFGYGPFGELLYKQGGAADDFRRLFNGKEQDQLTSLAYYGFRYYDKLTLTWTQTDPLYRFVPDLAWDEPRRAGLYGFTLNNPLRYIDPDGRDPKSDEQGKKDAENVAYKRLCGRSCKKRAKAAGADKATESAPDDGPIGDNEKAPGDGDDPDKAPGIKQLVNLLVGDGKGPKWLQDLWESVLPKVTVDTRKALDGLRILVSAIFTSTAGAVSKGFRSILGRGAARGGAQAVRVGRAGETAVRAAYSIGDKAKILVNGRHRIPDGLTSTVLSEVKNVKSLSFSRQLRDFADFAQQTGRRFDLYVRPNTTLSGPLQEAVQQGTINLRFIP